MKTKKLALAAICCAFTAVASQLVIPIQPVPFSFSLVAVYLTGALLDKKTAFWAQITYLLLGTVGVPVFSAFSGGLAKLAGPTGGYLFTYPLMAFAIAWAIEKWGRGFARYSIAMLASLLLCYTVGTAWLMMLTGSTLMGALSMAVFPFVAFDLVKIGLSAALAISLNRALVMARLVPKEALKIEK